MKPIIFLISIIFLLSFPLAGQKNYLPITGPPVQDTLLPVPKEHNMPELHNFNRKPEIHSDRKKYPENDRLRKSFPRDFSRKSIQDSIAGERYPGSSRFYAKSFSPRSAESGFEKSFIVVPDKTDKYFLIIMDPITGKITK